MSPECIITGADLIDTAHRCAVHGDLHRLGDALILNACLNRDGEALWRALPPQSDLVISAADFYECRGVIVMRAADVRWSDDAAKYVGEPWLAAAQEDPSLTVAKLRALATGMPYRGEASGEELLAWLRKYRPDVLP